MSRIKASVIIVTYNGALKIGRLLEALLIQSETNFETIVVVDGSTDNTIQILEPYLLRFFCLKIIEQKNSGRSKARNRGAKEAIGEFLVFYDDDMEPATDSVECHLRILGSDSKRILTGNQIELISADKTDIQNYKATLSHTWISGYSQNLVSLTIDIIFFTAANCSFPKEVFNNLEGFDERLTDAEDHDLAYRALQMGIAVYFDRDNKAIHRDPITCASYIKRLREYQRAQHKLAILHPERKHTRLYHETNIIKRFVYRLFALPFLVKLIDQEKLRFLPRKIRYKLYTIVIHSLANVFPSIPV